MADRTVTKPIVGSYGPLKPLAGHWAGRGLRIVSGPSNENGIPFRTTVHWTMETMHFEDFPETPNRSGPGGGPDGQDLDVIFLGLKCQHASRWTVQGEADPRRLHHVSMLQYLPKTGPSSSEMLIQLALTAGGPALVSQSTAVPHAIGHSSESPLKIADLAWTSLTQAELEKTLDPANDEVSPSYVVNPHRLLKPYLDTTRDLLSASIALEFDTHLSKRTDPLIDSGPLNIRTAKNPLDHSFSQVTTRYWIESLRNQDGSAGFSRLKYSQHHKFDLQGTTYHQISVANLERADPLENAR